MTKMDRLVEAMREAVTRNPADTSAALRGSIAERAAAPPAEGPEVPEALQVYLDKVAHTPFKVTDEEFAVH